MAIKFGDIFGSADININNPKLEEVLNKTRDMAETVGRKSAERLEISRKKVELLDAKTKLSKLFEKYGEFQYEIFIGNEVDSNQLDEVANRIAILKERIKVLTDEIEDAKVKFNESVSSVTKKTKDAFQKEFDKGSQNSSQNDEVIEVFAEDSDSDETEV